MEKKPEEKEEPHDEAYFMKKMKERVLSYHQRNSSAEVAKKEQDLPAAGSGGEDQRCTCPCKGSGEAAAKAGRRTAGIDPGNTCL